MIGARTRRALAAVILLLGMAVTAVAAPVHAKPKEEVDPFCIGVTDTWVEACVGSLYDTIAAVTQMVGMGMPL